MPDVQLARQHCPYSYQVRARVCHQFFTLGWSKKRVAEANGGHPCRQTIALIVKDYLAKGAVVCPQGRLGIKGRSMARPCTGCNDEEANVARRDGSSSSRLGGPTPRPLRSRPSLRPSLLRPSFRSGDIRESVLHPTLDELGWKIHRPIKRIFELRI